MIKIINVLFAVLLIKNVKLVTLKINALLASTKESMFSRVFVLSAHHLTKTALNVKKKTSASLVLIPTFQTLKIFALYALISIKIASNV